MKPHGTLEGAHPIIRVGLFAFFRRPRAGARVLADGVWGYRKRAGAKRRAPSELEGPCSTSCVRG